MLAQLSLLRVANGRIAQKSFRNAFRTFCFSVFATLAFGFAMGQAALKSDSVDYRPGSNAKFNGTGFQPGEVVKMQVLHSTDLADSSANEHTTVEMGASYIQGMYFVELVQGNQQKIVKLIKQ